MLPVTDTLSAGATPGRSQSIISAASAVPNTSSQTSSTVARQPGGNSGTSHPGRPPRSHQVGHPPQQGLRRQRSDQRAIVADEAPVALLLVVGERDARNVAERRRRADSPQQQRLAEHAQVVADEHHARVRGDDIPHAGHAALRLDHRAVHSEGLRETPPERRASLDDQEGRVDMAKRLAEPARIGWRAVTLRDDRPEHSTKPVGEPRHVERLDHVLEHAKLEDFPDDRLVALAGEHHDLEGGVLGRLTKGSQCLEAVHHRHLHVEERQVKTVVRQRLQRLPAVSRLGHLAAEALGQHAADEVPGGTIIIDEENLHPGSRIHARGGPSAMPSVDLPTDEPTGRRTLPAGWLFRKIGRNGGEA